jgi:hypothetical protein
MKTSERKDRGARYDYASRLPGDMAGAGPFADCSPGIQGFQQKNVIQITVLL